MATRKKLNPMHGEAAKKLEILLREKTGDSSASVTVTDAKPDKLGPMLKIAVTFDDDYEISTKVSTLIVESALGFIADCFKDVWDNRARNG